MDVFQARRVLDIKEDLNSLTEHTIRQAFYKKARQYHPDSPLCVTSKDVAGIKIKELIDARNCLLRLQNDTSCHPGNKKTTEQDMEEMMGIIGEMWKHGTLDESFPTDRIFKWFIQSPTVHSALDSLYVFTQSKSY